MAKTNNNRLNELVKVTNEFDIVSFVLLVENLNKAKQSKSYYNPLFELKTLSLVYGVSVSKSDLINQISLFEEAEFGNSEYGITSYFENQLSRLSDSLIQKVLISICNDGNMSINSKEDYIDICNLSFGGYGKSQFESYTPDSVNKLMGKLIELQKGESIYDCASGTGTSLLSIIEESNKVLSQEINSSEVIRQSLLFKLFDYKNVTISNKSSLSQPMTKENSVNKVICNPPFMQRTFEDVDPMLTVIDGKDYSSSKDGSVYFYNLMTKVAKHKAVFVVPAGLLFKSTYMAYEYKNWVLKSNFVEAVIQLPVGTFMPYSSVSTAIIVINKKKKDNKIMMIDLTDSSFVSKERRNIVINENSMDRICELIKNREVIKGLSACITINDMDPQMWNITPSRYIEFEENVLEEVNIQEFIDNRIKYLSEFESQTKKVNEMINKLKGVV